MAALKEAFITTARYVLGLEQREPSRLAPVGSPNSVSEKEIVDPYATLTHWELWMKLESGAITDPAAAKIYLEKAKADELRVAREYDAWAKDNPRPDRRHYPLEKIIATIEQKYDPFITGTDRDRARFFAQEAQTILAGAWKSGEARTQANQRAANLFMFAEHLAQSDRMKLAKQTRTRGYEVTAKL